MPQNDFKYEDVLVDVFRIEQCESYRFTHKPSGNVVLGIGTPRMSNKAKLELMDNLIQLVKNDTKTRSK